MTQTTANNPHILIMAAGTGGHIFPALAVAEELQRQGATIHWLSTLNGMEHRLVEPTGITLHPIDIQGIRGNGLKRLLAAPFKILAATLHARRIIKHHNIKAVVGFGGYVCGPGGFAAKLSGVPLIIHEQNALAGMTNRWLSKIATYTLQAFPTAFEPSPTVKLTGNPVRQAICDVPAPAQRYAGRTGAIRILVVGGSLGAQALNTGIPEALKLLSQSVIVKHQCGQKQLDAAQASYATHRCEQVSAEVVPFITDMAEAYGWADLIICRAGALTVTEITTVGLPAVFIPLPSAVDDHQTINAGYLEQVGAAVICPQQLLVGGQLLADTLAKLLDRSILLDMANKGYALRKPDASTQVAEWVKKAFEH